MFLEPIFSVVFSLLIFLLILTVVVIVHEAGHFFTAKRFGIKVEEFGFGFPPKAIAKKIGETIYSINWLPLGGFVKLYGEDEAGAGRIGVKKLSTVDLKRAYFARPPWQKALVIVAGVFMNLLLSFLIFYLFLGFSNFKTQVPLVGDNIPKFHGVNASENRSVYVQPSSKESPAFKAGIQSPMRIVSINGETISGSDRFIELINSNKGKQVLIVAEDQSLKKERYTLTPREKPPAGEGPIGVAVSSFGVMDLNYETPRQKLLSGIYHPFNLLFYSNSLIKDIVTTSVKEKTVEPVKESVSGPLGVFVLVGSVVSLSSGLKELFLQCLNLAGLLSITVAFFNILPIPALDGGRLVFVLYEMVTRRRVNQKVESIVNMFGIAVLLSLILYITVFF